MNVEAGIPSFAGVHHLKLPVGDLARSEAWYGRTLGYRRAADRRRCTGPDPDDRAPRPRPPGARPRPDRGRNHTVRFLVHYDDRLLEPADRGENAPMSVHPPALSQAVTQVGSTADGVNRKPRNGLRAATVVAGLLPPL